MSRSAPFSVSFSPSLFISSALSGGISEYPAFAYAPCVTAFLLPSFAGVLPPALLFPGCPPFFLGLPLNFSSHLSSDFHLLILVFGTPAAAARSSRLIRPPLSRYLCSYRSRSGFLALPMPPPLFVCFLSFDFRFLRKFKKCAYFRFAYLLYQERKCNNVQTLSFLYFIPCQRRIFPE